MAEPQVSERVRKRFEGFFTHEQYKVEGDNIGKVFIVKFAAADKIKRTRMANHAYAALRSENEWTQVLRNDPDCVPT